MTDTQASRTMNALVAPAWLDKLQGSLAVFLAINAAIGVAFSTYFFGSRFLHGQSASFISPEGDFETYLTGAQIFIHERWHFPLFATDMLQRSTPQSATFFDLVPLYAILAKVVYSLSGIDTPYLAWWYATAVTMQPIAFTLMLWSMGVRRPLLLVSGGVLAVLMPAFLFRVGHAPLFATFTFIVAIALYFAAIPTARNGLHWPTWVRLAWPGWLVLVTMTNLYLLFLAAAFFAAAWLQQLYDLRGREQRSAAAGWVLYGLLSMGLILCTLYILGYFIPYRSAGVLGQASMNMLSLIVPQRSSLFAGSIGFVDATGVQYEGYGYLGAGILMTIAAGVLVGRLSDYAVFKQHGALICSLAVLVLLAISNRAYFGDREIWSFSVPEALGMFRSSGRFIWPVLYVVLALALVGVSRLPTWRLVALLGLVLGLQWADTRMLAQGLWNFGHAVTPAPRADNEPELRKLIASYLGLHVEPDYFCPNTAVGNQYIEDLAWYAALERRPINTAYQARPPMDWTCEVGRPSLQEALSKGDLTIVLYDANKIPVGLDRSNCAERPNGLVCMAASGTVFAPTTINGLFSPEQNGGKP